MKKLLVLCCLTCGVTLFTHCDPARRSAKSAANVTYTKDIQPLIATHCTPCHIPAKGGKVEALDTYEAAKDEAGEIIRRIQLHPGDKGYMPYKRPRLSDSTIAVFSRWKDGGLMQ